ncbi:MAG TPA: hypothetical protein VGL77_08135 [Armatimonadota bacterium]
MPDAPMPLSPDDGPQTPLALSKDRAQPVAPYHLVAVMVGLFALFALNELFMGRGHHVLWLVVAVGIGGLFDLLLHGAHPKLPLRFLTVAAAELGMLLNLPREVVFPAYWRNPVNVLIVLLWWVIMAAITGMALSYWLRVEEHPTEVLVINFLVMFCLAGATFLWLI